jgi:acyl transferase domain-containing protein
MARDSHGRRALLDALAALFRAGHALRSPGEAGHLARALPLPARRFLPLSHGVQLEAEEASPLTLPLAAHSATSLAAMAASLSDRLGEKAELPLRDMLHKLARTRLSLPHRATITASTRHGLRDGLDALARGDHARGLVCTDPTQKLVRRAAGRLAFVFSGHGSQWQGMGRELLRSEPVFAEAIDACDAAFALCGPHRVRPVLEDASAPLPSRADRIQPLLFATQVALARVWLAWGVVPDVVLGHSVGEVAAAHIAGALDLPSAARVLTERAAALAPAIGAGAMALVELPLSRAQALVAPYGDRLAVAVHHSPSCSVLAGDRSALAEVLQALDAQQVFCRWVDVDYASHGPQMQPIARALRERLAEQPLRAAHGPRLPMFSTTLGRPVDDTPLDADYWARNLAQPVLFRETIEALVDSEVSRFVEISPHPLLGNGIAETALFAGREVAFVPSLRRNAPERQALAEALGQLFVAGHPVDFTRQHPSGDRSVSLPPYPFERRTHWASRAQEARATACGCAPALHAQPEPALTLARPEPALRDRLRDAEPAPRLELLRGLVRSELSRLLRVESARIEPEANFKELGVDSLLGLELRSRLESATGVALSSTSMWATPTLEGVAHQLMEVGRRSM